MSSYDTKLYLRTRGASGRRHHFPKITIRIEEGTEVLFVEGVQRIDPFAGEIVFIENDPDKIVAFLPFCPKGAVILSDEDDLRPYVWKKKQFVGALKTTRATLHHLHLALSEYSRFGKEIVQNIKENLLHVGPFIHGKYLERRFSGKKVMVCGSGPSLSFERLKNWDGWIFAAGSAMVKLLERGVRIDAGFAVDPYAYYPPLAHTRFPLFYQNRVNATLFKMHEGPKVWMGSSHGWPIEEWIYKQIGLESFFFDAGWNAGMFAFNVAHFLGCEVHYMGLDDTEGLLEPKRWETTYLMQSVCTVDARSVIARLNEPIPEIKAFLQQTTYDRRAHVLLEAELVGNPLYEELVEPLWKIFSMKGDFVAKMVFAEKVLW